MLPALNCARTIYQKKEPGRFVVSNCGTPRIVHIPPMGSHAVIACQAECDADERCLMIEWHANKAEDKCWLYPHNSYYESNIRRGQPRCQLIPTRRIYTTFREKICVSRSNRLQTKV